MKIECFTFSPDVGDYINGEEGVAIDTRGRFDRLAAGRSREWGEGLYRYVLLDGDRVLDQFFSDEEDLHWQA